MMTEGRYNNDDLLVRLRAVFGRVDQVRHRIDVALQQDDAHRRKRNMRFLVLPTRFPRPESMSQGDTTVWTNWIREETDEIMKQLEEERHSRSDPDDPFNGTANGVFQPLQDPLSLPPPVQTPKRQGNNSEDLEHFQNSRKNVRKHNPVSGEERRNETVTSAQGEPCEFREHSRDSLDPMASIRNLHIQQRQNRGSTEELNQNTSSAPQTTRTQVNQEEANLITFSPVVEQQIPALQGATGVQEQPKRQRSPRKKKGSEWTLNQRQFDHSKTQEISHILPGEQLNMFNGEESVSYLQLPVKKKDQNRYCTRRYCQVNTWCKFCITDTHATQACRKYEKFVQDNPIVSSRRNTPVQVQGERVTVNPQDQPQQPQPLFPHPPVQRYNPTVIPRMQMHNVALQREKRESREHSRNSPQNQIREVQTQMSKQLLHQRSCQDVRMDPHYQEPPQYAEINYHRPSPQRPVEVNEIGPTIQQGVIQRPVQRHTQHTEGPRIPTVPVTEQQMTSVPSLQINNNGGTHERARQQESDPEENGYVINCIHENRPFTVNDVGRPVFVNHYYAGEAFIPVTNKKLIKLDECDVSTEISWRNAQPQAIEREFGEHSRNSRIMQQTAEGERKQGREMQPSTAIYEKIPKIR